MLLAGFLGLSALLFLILQAIRIRLRDYDSDVFIRLGSPSWRDSTMTKSYWLFQRFVLWGHLTEIKDAPLHALCLLATLSALAWFAVIIWGIG